MPKSKFDPTKIDLRTRGVLVRISISGYSGNKLDANISSEVAAQKNSKSHSATDAYRVNKVIYNREYLRPVGRISLNFYKWLRERSHEWAHGVYLISAESLNEVLTEYQKAKMEWNKAMTNLKSPDCRDDALRDYRDRAGDGFDESLWPTTDELDERFSFDLDVEHLPDPKTNAHLIYKIGEEAAEKISEDNKKRMDKKSAETVKSTARRIGDIVRKIQIALNATRTNKENTTVPAVFKDSLIGNLRDAVELIDLLNITGDPTITEMKNKIIKELCGAEPAVLRKDSVKRKATAKKAKQIADKLSQLSK